MIIWIAFVWDGGHPSDGIMGKSQHSLKWKRCANPAKNDTQWTRFDGMKRSKHIWSMTLNIGWIIWRPDTKRTTTNPAVEEKYFKRSSTCPNPFPLRIFTMTWEKSNVNETLETRVCYQYNVINKIIFIHLEDAYLPKKDRTYQQKYIDDVVL